MDEQALQTWLQSRLPPEVLAAPPELSFYEDELVIVLCAAASAGAPAEHELIDRLRKQTRPLRVRLAREIQAATGLPVAWGLRVGATEELFTSRSAPVMTRLGRAERELLDTLVAAGVAETRSAALGYVVRAFAREHADWLAEMRTALDQVRLVRARLTLTPRGEPPEQR